jgi:hypothetical protein
MERDIADMTEYNKKTLNIILGLLFVLILTGCYVAPAPIRVAPSPGVIVVPPQPRPGAVWVAPRRLLNGTWVRGYWR